MSTLTMFFLHPNQTALIGYVSTMEANKCNLINLFHIVTRLISILRLYISEASCKSLNAVLENTVHSFIYVVSEDFFQHPTLCIKLLYKCAAAAE